MGVHNTGVENQAFSIEQRGIEFVPENERTMKPRELGIFWAGSSMYPFNVLLGGLIYGLGNLVENALASVLEQAARPDLADRYNPIEFAKALVQVASRLPQPTPLQRSMPRRPTTPRPGGVRVCPLRTPTARNSRCSTAPMSWARCAGNFWVDTTSTTRWQRSPPHGMRACRPRCPARPSKNSAV